MINPKSTLLLYEIGLAYSKLENKKKAMKYWKKLLRSVSPHNYFAVQVEQKLKSRNLLNNSLT